MDWGAAFGAAAQTGMELDKRREDKRRYELQDKRAQVSADRESTRFGWEEKEKLRALEQQKNMDTIMSGVNDLSALHASLQSLPDGAVIPAEMHGGISKFANEHPVMQDGKRLSIQTLGGAPVAMYGTPGRMDAQTRPLTKEAVLGSLGYAHDRLNAELARAGGPEAFQKWYAQQKDYGFKDKEIGVKQDANRITEKGHDQVNALGVRELNEYKIPMGRAQQGYYQSGANLHNAQAGAAGYSLQRLQGTDALIDQLGRTIAPPGNGTSPRQVDNNILAQRGAPAIAAQLEARIPGADFGRYVYPEQYKQGRGAGLQTPAMSQKDYIDTLKYVDEKLGADPQYQTLLKNNPAEAERVRNGLMATVIPFANIKGGSTLHSQQGGAPAYDVRPPSGPPHPPKASSGQQRVDPWMLGDTSQGTGHFNWRKLGIGQRFNPEWE